MSKLRECPFCGKKPEFVKSYSKVRLHHECEVISINMSWGKKPDLIEKWNERHIPKHETIEEWEKVNDFETEENKSYYVFDCHKRLIGIGIMNIIEGVPFWNTLHDTVINNFCVTHIKAIKDLPEIEITHENSK